MVTVGLVNNFDEICGVGAQGHHLIDYAHSDVNYVRIPAMSSISDAMSLARKCDIVHLNYMPAIQYFPLENFVTLLPNSIPIVLTNHVTNWGAPWYAKLTEIVTHLPVGPEYPFHTELIPMGIPSYDYKRVPATEVITLTQCGFPFAWKNFPAVCWAGASLVASGIPCRVILYTPMTFRQDPTSMINECKAAFPDLDMEFVTEYLELPELIQQMHERASVSVFYTQSLPDGASGSVRLAIAARRPVIINEEGYQYQDILNYEGIYPVSSASELPAAILKAHTEGKSPDFLLEDLSYKRTCLRYRDLYLKLLEK